MNIGKTIKFLRERKNLTQKQLAEMCNCSLNYIYSIENDKRNPSTSFIEELGKALDMPAPVLMYMTLKEEHIPEHKKEMFRVVNPAVKALINEIFN